MARLPDAMRMGNRPPDQQFEDDERLFRAFAADDLEGDKIALDAIELPDMSVNREKYGPRSGCCILKFGLAVAWPPSGSATPGSRSFTTASWITGST
jgi:hypothetical protein